MQASVRTRALGAVCAFCMVFGFGAAAPGSPLAQRTDSPVADAAMRGHVDTVRTLLRDGEDVNAAQPDGMTALHWAALNDDVATMQALLYAGANTQATTRLGAYTPLHLASQSGHAAAVAGLLDAGSDATAVTDTGVGALHYASQAGNPAAIEALLAHGADVNMRDAHAERTPLIFATANDRLEAMEALLAAGADVSLATKTIDYPELSTTDSAARSLRSRVVAAERGVPVQQRGFGGTPPGQMPPTAAARGRGGRRGAQAQPPDPDDPPAAPAARRGGRALPPDPDDPPTTPPDPDDPPRTPPDPDDPPGTPGTPGNPADPAPTRDPNVPRSLSNTEQIGLQGGFTALHYAARDGRADAALLLLEAGADIDHRTADDSSPLLVAAINGNFDLAMMLLERGADPNFTSDDGVTPLFAAINNEWALRTWYPQPTASQQQQTTYLELMQALLEAGADPDTRTTTHVWYAAYNAGRMGVDFTGATAFWRAAYALDVDAMRLLVEHGADPNLSTLKLEGGRNRRSAFQNLQRPPGAPNRQDPEDEDGPEADPSGLPERQPGEPHVHPLHAASGVGFGTSRVGQQHRHVPDGWLAAVRYMVDELGIDVNVRDDDGYAAVHNAAARGDNEMIEFLVENGADVSVVSRRGQTTVDMANGPQQRVQPFPETIALLESLGAKNNNNCISC